MRKIAFYLFMLFVVITGCKKDENEIETGDLSITVIAGYSTFLENAEVYTKPATIQGKTDSFGSVLLKGLKTGSYEIFASYENLGSGKVTVNIKANELTEATIHIVQGIYVGIAPEINLILPVQPAEFSEGEMIGFSADVNDDDTPATSLKVKWESDLDGLLNSDPPNATGNVAFVTSSLSRGVHQITLSVEDEDGYKASRSIQVSTIAPKAVTLNQPLTNQGKVELSWSVFDGSGFSKYEVFRTRGDGTSQGHELVATLTDVNVVTATDSRPPFSYRAGYYVRVTNNEGYSRNSIEKIVEYPGGPVFNFVPSDMLKHPTDHYVYLVDKSGKRLIKYDYLNSNEVGSTSLQGTVGKCDIGENGFGVEIYVPSSDGYVYVYNAGSLTLTSQILTDKYNTSASIDGNGHVLVALDPSPDAWWTDPLRTFSRANGMLIDGNGDFERDINRRIPGKREFISISTGVSPVDMDYYKLAEDGTFELHSDDPYHGDHNLNPSIFRISDNGEYVITASTGAVYLANSSMEYKGELESGSLAYSDFAFSSDGSVIYAATSNRKSIQIGGYPSLIRTNEILLKGYPVWIARDGNKLIAVSRSEEGSITTGIEIVETDN